MIALFFATRIINQNSEYKRVPKLIKEQVADILREKGYEHLITEGEEN